MQIRNKTRAALAAGQTLPGVFWPAPNEVSTGGQVFRDPSDPERQASPTAGTLTWSAEHGTALELIGDVTGWPNDLRGDAFTVHGLLRDADEVTLLATWVKSVAFVRQPVRLRSPTLALGGHVLSTTRWPRAIYSTANLSEWRWDTGLSFKRPSKARPHHLRIDVQPPAREEVTLPRATVAFAGAADSVVAHSADWSVHTWQRFVVDANRPMTLARARSEYAEPLVALSAFAADRPDGITEEILLDPASGRRIEVWQQGRTIDAPEWQPDSLLFYAYQIKRFSRAIRRWWKLHSDVWPALGMFGHQLAEGHVYSPARLITVHTALEAYCRTRFGTKDFKRVRTYGQVDSAVTGATNNALALLGVSRDYFAHLGFTGQKYSREDVEDATLDSIRRASALMQACLLRELGFRKAKANELMARHYFNWPIPAL